MVFAGLAVVACTKRSSLFMEPGKPEPGRAGHEVPKPPGGGAKPSQ